MSDDRIKKGDFGAARPLQSPGFKPSIRVRPHIGTMLGDSYVILHTELQNLLEIQQSGQGLSPRDTNKFKALVESLTRLAKEEREQEAKNDPSLLPDDKLLELAQEAYTVLQPGDGKDE